MPIVLEENEHHDMYGEDKGEVVDIGFCPVTSVQKERFSVEEAQGPNNKISISKCF